MKQTKKPTSAKGKGDIPINEVWFRPGELFVKRTFARIAMLKGIEPDKVDATFSAMLSSGKIKQHSKTGLNNETILYKAS